MSGSGLDSEDIEMKDVVPILQDLRLYWESEKWEVHSRTMEVLTKRRTRGIW